MERTVGKTVRLIKRAPSRIVERLGGRAKDAGRRRDNWDRRWGDDRYKPVFELTQSDPAVRQAVGDGWITVDMTAVDIGCGGGYNAAWLAKQGVEAVGIDFSAEAVARARGRFPDTANLSFEVVDVIESGYDRSFDALIDRGCLHGIDRRHWPRYVENLGRWAKPGAHFLLIMRNKGRPNDEVVAETRTLLESDFEFVESHLSDLSGPYSDDPLPGVAVRFTRRS